MNAFAREMFGDPLPIKQPVANPLVAQAQLKQGPAFARGSLMAFMQNLGVPKTWQRTAARVFEETGLPFAWDLMQRHRHGMDYSALEYPLAAAVVLGVAPSAGTIGKGARQAAKTARRLVPKGFTKGIDVPWKPYGMEDYQSRGAIEFFSRPGRTPQHRDVLAIPKNVPENIQTFRPRKAREGIAFYNPEKAKLRVADEGDEFLERTYIEPKEPGIDFSYGGPMDRAASDDVMWRGMSADEFEEFQRTGKIESRGAYNVQSQEGLTYWSARPSQAHEYSSGFAPGPWKPTFDRPAYIVKAKRPGSERITKVGGTGPEEIGVMGATSKDDVLEIYRGDVIGYTPAEHDLVDDWGTWRGGGSGPNIVLQWTKQGSDGPQSLLMDEASRMARARQMGFDVDRPIYHGTTHQFREFQPSHGQRYETGGYHGPGTYASSSYADAADNYAGTGPDLTNRLERRTDEIEQEILDWDHTFRSRNPDAVRRLAWMKARKELVGEVPEGRTLDLRHRMENPVEVDAAAGGTRNTFFEINDGYDPDLEDWVEEPSGEAAELIEAVRNELYDLDIPYEAGDEIASELYQAAMEDGGIDARDFEDLVRRSNAMDWVYDTGSSPGQIIQNAYRSVGRDGVIMHNAGRQFPGMNIEPGTDHFVIFEPEKLREAHAAFDPAKKFSADLSANVNPMVATGLGGAGLLGLILQQNIEAQQGAANE